MENGSMPHPVMPLPEPNLMRSFHPRAVWFLLQFPLATVSGSPESLEVTVDGVTVGICEQQSKNAGKQKKHVRERH